MSSRATSQTTIQEEEEVRPSSNRSVVLKKTTLVPKADENIEPINKEEKTESPISSFYLGVKETAHKVAETADKAIPKVIQGVKDIGQDLHDFWRSGQQTGWKEQEAIMELADKLYRDTGMPYNQARKKVTDSKWWEHMDKREKRIEELMEQNQMDRKQAVKQWKSENDYQ